MPLAVKWQHTTFDVDHHEDHAMNKHQVKGAAKEAAGKVQRKTGTLLSNRKQEIKGTAAEVTGKAQRAYGNVKNDAQKARRAREERRV